MYEFLHSQDATAAEICRELQGKGYSIDKRSIQRDLSDFNGLMGLHPVSEARGPTAAVWSVDHIDFLSLNDNNYATALAIVMAEQQLRATAPPQITNQLKKPFDKAKKLIESDKGLTGRWYNKVKVSNPSHWLKPPHIDENIFSIVKEAALENSVLELIYKKHQSDSDVENVTVTAKGLFYRGNVAYLVAYAHSKSDDSIKSYRNLPISRIVRAKRRNFEEPQGPVNFSINDDTNAQLFEFRYGEPFTLELMIFKAVQREVEDAHLGDNQVVTEISGNEDFKLLKATVPYNLNLIQWLLARAPYLKVVGPPEFKAKFEEEVKRAYYNVAHDEPHVPKDRNF
ncbi:MAG: helix-turn-helix transcriptional regulator [Pseudomonadota bacterium]